MRTFIRFFLGLVCGLSVGFLLQSGLGSSWVNDPMHHKARDLNMATSLCQAKIKQLKEVPWAEVGTGGSPAVDRLRSMRIGAAQEQMVQEGSLLAGRGINLEGFSEGTVEVPCAHWPFTGPVETVRNRQCRKEASRGPFKFVRTFVVCHGKQHAAGRLGKTSGDQQKRRGLPSKYVREELERPCLVSESDESTRTEFLTCSSQDFDEVLDPANAKKVKTLCSWRGDDGRCHSVHIHSILVVPGSTKG